MEGALKIGAYDTPDDQDQSFLVIYDYVESEVTKRCGFICQAKTHKGPQNPSGSSIRASGFTLLA